MEPHDEIVDKPHHGVLGGPVRKVYTPAETELGIEFCTRLESPEPADCRLGDKVRLIADLPVTTSN